jgi:phosphatidylinositol alpha-1,6-mannosyltransferase
MRPVQKLVFVSTALRLEDGGAASLSRVIAAAAQTYCQQHDIAFEILDLGQPSDMMEGIKTQYFMGNQLALARVVWKQGLFSPKTALMFIHIGPARALGILPRFLLPPYMIWILGFEVWCPFTFERRRAMSLAKMRVAISSFTERRTREFHEWLPPTEVLLLALEDRPISGEPDAALLKKIGEQAILITSRLSSAERYKGHDELLQTMPAVLAKCPQAQLIIAGKGDDMPRLQAEAAKLDISDQVIFTGFVSDATLQALFEKCRVFAMPSRYEGFGLVFLEAMKAARPCVALRDSSAAEIIVDGETGLLVEYGEQLTNALLRLLQDDAYSVQLGKAGRRRWQEHFTRSAFDTRFHKLLDQLCGRGA